MLAIAVSSAAIASAVKIARTAHRLRSGGKPSVAGDCFAEIASISRSVLKAGRVAYYAYVAGIGSGLHWRWRMRHMRTD